MAHEQFEIIEQLESRLIEAQAEIKRWKMVVKATMAENDQLEWRLREEWAEIEKLNGERNHWRQVALHSQQKQMEYLDDLKNSEIDTGLLEAALQPMDQGVLDELMEGKH
jgi:regulator of replication initiation timing